MPLELEGRGCGRQVRSPIGPAEARPQQPPRPYKAHGQVDRVVLLGPFPDSPVGYPPAGQDGPGRVAGDALRAMAPLVREAGFHFVPDAPAARELLAQLLARRRLIEDQIVVDVDPISRRPPRIIAKNRSTFRGKSFYRPNGVIAPLSTHCNDYRL
jgi:hypothetical protein